MTATYLRKVIRIKATDSPNVALALWQERQGAEVTGEVVCPGVLTWQEYQSRLKLWSEQRQSIGLWAEFWEGKESWLFPVEWLNAAEEIGRRLAGKKRAAKAVGVDPAEGGDSTCFCAGDEDGVIELRSLKTPDTNVIIGETISFGRRHGVPAEHWVFDAGGGKQHADRLRAKGFNVRTVGFGSAVSATPRRGMARLTDRIDLKESRYTYLNRRAQMYCEASMLFDVSVGPGYGIPPGCGELRRQLSLMPRAHDEEGRAKLPPKSKRSAASKEQTLVEMLGCSPDEADSMVLMVHGMLHEEPRAKAGAV